MATEIRLHRLHHTKSTSANPQSHTAATRAGSSWIRFEGPVEEALREIIAIAGCLKGWLTSSIAKYNPAFGPAELRDHAKWLPMPASNENGIRNFSDAVSQSQYGKERRLP
jgi:hypothetical protein